MIASLMITQAAALGVIGAIVAVAGLAKRRFGDWVLISAGLALVTLIVQVVASIIAPFVGSAPTGDPFEYWTYLVTALLIPPAAVLWALIDRQGTWSTLIVGIGILACAVMVYRMHQIWFVQVV